MNVKTFGLLAGLALCGTAFAQSGQQQQTQQEQMQHKSQKELNGTVVGVKEKDLLVRLDEDPNPIVPLRVDHQTHLDGKTLKKDQRIESHLKKEFSPGAEVRASFDVEKMENKAISIEHKK